MDIQKERNDPPSPQKRRWLQASVAFVVAASCGKVLAAEAEVQPGSQVSPKDFVALTQLLTEMVWRIDHGAASKVHELFVPDGSLTVLPLQLQGTSALEQWGKSFDAHPSGMQHVVTNARFNYLTQNRVEGTSTLISFDAGQQRDLKTLPAIIGMDQDILVRTLSGWKFESRKWLPWLSREGGAAS